MARILSEKAKGRYNTFIATVKKEGNIDLVGLAGLWGVSHGAAQQQVLWFRRLGLDVPPIKRTKWGTGRYVNKKTKRANHYKRDGDVVDKANLGDPNMPVCPDCAAANRVGSGETAVHLVKDEDGFVFCQSCGYTFPFSMLDERPKK